MTNTEDDLNDSNYSQIAAMLAVQIVSQVINEAQTIVQALQGPGEPQFHTSLLKKISNAERFGKEISELIISMSKNKEKDNVDKETIIATSTPQKELDRVFKSKNCEIENEPIVTGIGGGDERTISEMEHVVTSSYYNEQLVHNSENSIFELHNVENVSEIIEAFLNRGLNVALHNGNDILESEILHEIEKISPQDSTYSLLLDTETTKGNRESFSINDEVQNKNESNKLYATNDKAVTPEQNEQNGFTFYEKTFLTLNRDEHDSEDGGPMLDNVKSASLQDVELLPLHTSHETVKSHNEEKKEESYSGLRSKRSVIKQWKKNGIRLLAFIRNFWRRKTLKSKISTSVPSKLAFCSMSSNGKRLTSSLLENRSPTLSPTRRCARKFNTVNETTLFPQRWRKYASKYNLEEVTGVFEQEL